MPFNTFISQNNTVRTRMYDISADPYLAECLLRLAPLSIKRSTQDVDAALVGHNENTTSLSNTFPAFIMGLYLSGPFCRCIKNKI